MNTEDLKSIKFVVNKDGVNRQSRFDSGAVTEVSGQDLRKAVKSELANSVLKKISLNNQYKQISKEIELIKSVLDSIEDTDYQLNTEFVNKLGL